MADSRYVIELILNARDNTAGAFQKALGEQKKFIDQQEKDTVKEFIIKNISNVTTITK